MALPVLTRGLTRAAVNELPSGRPNFVRWMFAVLNGAATGPLTRAAVNELPSGRPNFVRWMFAVMGGSAAKGLTEQAINEFPGGGRANFVRWMRAAQVGVGAPVGNANTITDPDLAASSWRQRINNVAPGGPGDGARLAPSATPFVDPVHPNAFELNAALVPVDPGNGGSWIERWDRHDGTAMVLQGWVSLFPGDVNPVSVVLQLLQVGLVEIGGVGNARAFALCTDDTWQFVQVPVICGPRAVCPRVMLVDGLYNIAGPLTQFGGTTRARVAGLELVSTGTPSGPRSGSFVMLPLSNSLLLQNCVTERIYRADLPGLDGPYQLTVGGSSPTYECRTDATLFTLTSCAGNLGSVGGPFAFEKHFFCVREWNASGTAHVDHEIAFTGVADGFVSQNFTINSFSGKRRILFMFQGILANDTSTNWAAAALYWAMGSVFETVPPRTGRRILMVGDSLDDGTNKAGICPDYYPQRVRDIWRSIGDDFDNYSVANTDQSADTQQYAGVTVTAASLYVQMLGRKSYDLFVESGSHNPWALNAPRGSMEAMLDEVRLFHPLLPFRIQTQFLGPIPPFIAGYLDTLNAAIPPYTLRQQIGDLYAWAQADGNAEIVPRDALCTYEDIAADPAMLPAGGHGTAVCDAIVAPPFAAYVYDPSPLVPVATSITPSGGAAATPFQINGNFLALSGGATIGGIAVVAFQAQGILLLGQAPGGLAPGAHDVVITHPNGNITLPGAWTTP